MLRPRCGRARVRGGRRCSRRVGSRERVSRPPVVEKPTWRKPFRRSRCRLPRHSLQQARAQPVERPPREGRRLDRAAGREHRAAYPAAEPERPGRPRCRRQRDRHVRGAGGRPALSRARASGEAEAHGEDAAGPLRRSGRAALPRTTRSRRTTSGSACIRSISSAPSRRCAISGMSEEDIAARHFVTPAIVKQRLRLASVSPKLHEVYAEDGMTLEQLMAFSVTADHARQEQVWENVSRSGYDEPYQIRRMLTEKRRPRLRPSRAVRRPRQPTSRPAAASCAICSSTMTAAGCRTSPCSIVWLPRS